MIHTLASTVPICSEKYTNASNTSVAATKTHSKTPPATRIFPSGARELALQKNSVRLCLVDLSQTKRGVFFFSRSALAQKWHAKRAKPWRFVAFCPSTVRLLARSFGPHGLPWPLGFPLGFGFGQALATGAAWAGLCVLK